MSRIRTIKPEFWGDEKLARMDDFTRFLFLALISMADDCGRLLDSPKQIDAFAWPHDDDPAAFATRSRMIRESLATLSRAGRIVRGATPSGQQVIQIAHWAKHQRVDKPNTKAALPEIIATEEDSGDSRDIRDALANDSRGIRDTLAPRSTTYDLRAGTNDQRPTTVVAVRARRADDDGAALVDRVLEAVTDDPHGAAVRTALRSAKQPTTLAGELGAWVDGMRGAPVSWAIVARAVHELAVAETRLTPATLGAFIRRLEAGAHGTSVRGPAPEDDAATWDRLIAEANAKAEASATPEAA